jgi:hypothetical protein
VYVGSLDSPQGTRLFASESLAQYAAPGYVLFNRGDAVFAQAFDADALALKGERSMAEPIRDGGVTGRSSTSLSTTTSLRPTFA